jgi:hypothetical protein
LQIIIFLSNVCCTHSTEITQSCFTSLNATFLDYKVYCELMIILHALWNIVANTDLNYIIYLSSVWISKFLKPKLNFTSSIMIWT